MLNWMFYTSQLNHLKKWFDAPFQFLLSFTWLVEEELLQQQHLLHISGFAIHSEFVEVNTRTCLVAIVVDCLPDQGMITGFVFTIGEGRHLLAFHVKDFDSYMACFSQAEIDIGDRVERIRVVLLDSSNTR